MDSNKAKKSPVDLKRTIFLYINHGLKDTFMQPKNRIAGCILSNSHLEHFDFN